MKLTQEQLRTIAHSVALAKKRIAELDAKVMRSPAEDYERDMTFNCIRRGEEILKDAQLPFPVPPGGGEGEA